MSAESEAPGWEAIDEALRPLYGSTEPKHYAAVIPYALGGNEPLNGISVYKNSAPRPHWHFVTYGLSELFDKETENPAISGYGFELTFRLACAPDEEEPPAWAMNFLQNLARYVFKTGNVFDVGHHMGLNGPIMLGSDTLIEAILFARDPKLPSIDTPNGSLKFLQVVGITLDELDAVKDWDSEKFLGMMADFQPLLLTGLERRSLLEDARFAEAVRLGAERDGSSMWGLFPSQLKWERRGEKLELTVGALIVDQLGRMLRGRTLHGRPFMLRSPELAVEVRPGEAVRWATEEHLVVSLTPAAARELRAGLVAKRGRYTFKGLPGFTLVVQPTEIKDPAGKVLRVVG
jgi:hypothetical protein